MATAHDQQILRQLGTLLAVGTSGELTDGQLLERFATRTGDAAEQAFATLVERHGPMVLRVCRSVLFHSNDVEDAFQATFLVLVQKARSLWVCDSLGPWLHEVALRTALRARSAAARRRRHERGAAVSVQAALTDSHDDLTRLLHDEINRLPDRFRVSVVLCDLEGNTHEQAARHLGWPVGTVKSRLARARERLRNQLTRRGLSPSAGVITLFRPGVMGDLLPGALVHSTVRAAVRFGVSRTLLCGSAAILAQGVLTAMSMTRWWKVASVLLVAGATVSGAGLISGTGGILAVEPRAQSAAKGDAGPGGAGSEMPLASANRGMFRIAATQRGVVEASKSEDVLSRANGNTTVISIVPEGTRVKKGSLVAELDSAGLKNGLTNQRITTRSAQAALEKSKLTREVAEIAVSEYEEGVYPQDVQAIQAGIKTTEAEIKNTATRLERTLRARERLKAEVPRDRPPSSSDIMAELDLDDRIDAIKLAMEHTRYSLEQAQTKLKILNDFTKPKTLKELRSEVEKARSTELARQQTYALEVANEKRLVQQIENCKLLAPADGIVVLANDPHRPAGQWPPQIREGTTVTPRQIIFSVWDLDSPMQVNAKVAESIVDRVQPGQKVQVLVDAFPGERFSGTVTEVAPMPDPGSPGGVEKVYSTRITLDGQQKFLRPGMTADTTILVAEHDQALTIPWDALFQFENKDHVAVRKPDGSFEWREVVLGDSESRTRLVQIKRGLEPGDQVALRPSELMSEYDKHRKGIGLPTKPAARK